MQNRIILEDTDTLVFDGYEVKATTQPDGGVKLGGYLVRFTTERDPDLSKEHDFFTAETDFDVSEWPMKSTIYWNHGADSALKKRKLGVATLTTNDVGVWAETILKERDAYEKMIGDLALAGKVGWSSGTASHLVEREPHGTANWVKKWPLGLDASLTHTPAEPRNSVVSLKSIVIENLPDISNKEKSMEITDERLAEIVNTAATKAVEEALKAMPAEPHKKAGFQVTHDEGDTPFDYFGQQLIAVKNWELSHGQEYDPRLRRLAVKGTEAKVMSELVGSDGGFLVQQDFSTELIKPVHEIGPFSPRARSLPIGNNANAGTINGVDETSRVTGSRWGGIRGYRLGEGGTKLPSDLSFREIKWRLKKYAVLWVATDELLEDQPELQEVFRDGVSEELNFMLNDDIFRGDGSAGPLGYMNSPSLVTIPKEAGQLADTIVAENIIKMYTRMYSRSMSNAVWFINQECLPQLFTMAIPIGLGGVPLYMPPGGLSATPYATLLGRPVIVNEFSSAVGDLGDITFADMSEYLWWQKVSPQSASSIHVYFVTDKTAFRTVWRVDGIPSWGGTLTPFKGSATQSPFIALAAR